MLWVIKNSTISELFLYQQLFFSFSQPYYIGKIFSRRFFEAFTYISCLIPLGHHEDYNTNLLPINIIIIIHDLRTFKIKNTIPYVIEWFN